MIWECVFVDVGVSEQRTLFLKESTEARITCPNQKLFIGGRMSWEEGEVCARGCPLSLSTPYWCALFIYALQHSEQVPRDHTVTVI